MIYDQINEILLLLSQALDRRFCIEIFEFLTFCKRYNPCKKLCFLNSSADLDLNFKMPENSLKLLHVPEEKLWCSKRYLFSSLRYGMIAYDFSAHIKYDLTKKSVNRIIYFQRKTYFSLF